jgi:hypothetical protein
MHNCQARSDQLGAYPWEQPYGRVAGDQAETYDDRIAPAAVEPNRRPMALAALDLA